jgi:hypothetical protein
METEPQDAKVEVADSSTVTDDNRVAAPSAVAEQQPAQSNEPTMADVVNKVVEKAAKADKEAEGERTQEVNPSEKKPSESEEPAGKEETVEDEPPPFHEHPAWKRVVSERNEAREALKQYEAVKPILERQQQVESVCQTHNINLNELLDVAVKMQTDPAAAYKILKPITDSLSAFTGEVVPSQLPPDLQAKVKEGLLDPETAAELFKLRSEKVRLEKRGELTVQQQQMQHVAVMTDAMNKWDEDKRKTDPDFEKKLAQVQRTWIAMYNERDTNGQPRNPVRSPQDAVALCERAYSEVSKLLTTFLPPKPTRRALNSSGSLTTNPDSAPAKTMQEHIQRVLKSKHGIG